VGEVGATKLRRVRATTSLFLILLFFFVPSRFLSELQDWSIMHQFMSGMRLRRKK